MIETAEIKMPAKRMFSTLFTLNGTLWVSIALAGIILFSIIGAAVDARFFILALIWIFLILPMVVAFLYFYYGMQPLTAFNMIPHRLKFNNEELTVEFIEENEDGKYHDNRKDYFLKRGECEAVKWGADYLLLFFHKKGWLWVPLDGFESIEAFRDIAQDFMNQESTIKGNAG